MASPSVQVDVRDVIEAFRIAPERMRAAAQLALKKAGLFLEGEMEKAAPHKTGILKATIGSEQRGMSVEIGVLRPTGGKPLVYAGIQHDGGTIHGKPWLVFPPKGSPILTPAGVGGIRARNVRDNPQQFGFVRTVALPRKNPRAIIGVRSDGSTELLFVVKRKVTLEGKHYISGPFERNREKVIAWIRDEIGKAVAIAA